MDRRLIACAAAALVGLSVGGLFWAAGGDGPQVKALGDLERRLDAISTRVRRGPDQPSEALARTQAAPLFSAAEKIEGVADMSIQLLGLARSPGRSAALLAIAGAPAQWLSLGEESRGVSLDAVTDVGVSLTTPGGQREISLAASDLSASGAPPDGAPPGSRGPPPPASAPRVK